MLTWDDASGQFIPLPGGGGSVTAANSGVSLSGTTVQLGNSVGGTTANFTADREIPLNNNSLFLSGLSKQIRFGSEASYIRFADSTANGVGSIQVKYPSSDASFQRTVLKVFPPYHSGSSQQSPYYFGFANTAQSGNNGNNVWMEGWNLSPGGSKYEAGKPELS